MCDKLILNVKTVPAWDGVQMCDHTAYSVSATINGKFTFSAGWTLRDAIELYSKIYKCNKDSIQLKRPFKKQIIKPFPI